METQRSVQERSLENSNTERDLGVQCGRAKAVMGYGRRKDGDNLGLPAPGHLVAESREGGTVSGSASPSALSLPFLPLLQPPVSHQNGPEALQLFDHLITREREVHTQREERNNTND